MARKADPDRGEIDPGKTYRLDEFMRVSGFGLKSMRHARSTGLRVLRGGRRVFVRGSDFVAWLESMSSCGCTSDDAAPGANEPAPAA